VCKRRPWVYCFVQTLAEIDKGDGHGVAEIDKGDGHGAPNM